MTIRNTTGDVVDSKKGLCELELYSKHQLQITSGFLTDLGGGRLLSAWRQREGDQH